MSMRVDMFWWEGGGAAAVFGFASWQNRMAPAWELLKCRHHQPLAHAVTAQAEHVPAVANAVNVASPRVRATRHRAAAQLAVVRLRAAAFDSNESVYLSGVFCRETRPRPSPSRSWNSADKYQGLGPRSFLEE
jgi:hypothetical protein